jgi:predicted aspartyl protease
MFGGMIPLQQGDYAITTEVTPHTDAQQVEGKAPLVFDGRHLFTRGHAGGAAGSFIVDVGAGSTVVTEEFLPEGTSIARLKGIEYSDHGTRIVDGSAGGLGGTVESFLGKAVLPVLTIGSVTFHDLSVSVISDMPSFNSKNPVGILGLDLLSRADQVSIQYESDEASLVWENGDIVVGEAIVEIPFTMAGNHLFIEGRIDGTPVSLVLDTGARLSMIPSPLAREAAMASAGLPLEMLRGLDGTPVEVSAATADQFTLGEAEFSDVVFHVGDFAVLESWGLQKNGGILGNDFLQRFREVRFDFRNQIARFISR